MERKFEIGTLVGQYKPWRHAVDAPFYQVTGYDEKTKTYELTRVNIKHTCLVYYHPVKDSFHETKEKIQCVLFRKNGCLSRRANSKYDVNAVSGFIHYHKARENGEYGYDD